MPEETVVNFGVICFSPASYSAPSTNQSVAHGGRGFGGRGQRGRGAGDRGQIQQGQGHARVFALTQQDAQASNTVVSGILPVCFF